MLFRRNSHPGALRCCCIPGRNASPAVALPQRILDVRYGYDLSRSNGDTSKHPSVRKESREKRVGSEESGMKITSD
ncbi:predicted protein [Uncinocarpus reesii 1704]|uniref:Uncharacterized protein n=1 Tax=Uncinocarpus reesii (strain UAMH 1704) TaxID=336963 RepID=C4JFC5_UNCRE|nr:uncharacterized protein UREG_02347 [Uncinocarpus reesii 1704]EEP77498.1 predicted protein [Uncinocarpus reesii 1704]